MATVSTLEMALLGLLKQKPQSGYDLRKTFATTAMRHYSDSPGSIYPALRRLEGREWIVPAASGRAVADDSRRRQEFALTETGKDVLVRWLGQEVSREDVTFRLSELMLRFAFMDGNISRSTTVRFLDQFRRELGIYAGELRAQFEQTSARAPVHTGLLAFELGIRSMETQLAWAREARARLSETSI
jgi:DNA-binding PadR family transcriptional regulator